MIGKPLTRFRRGDRVPIHKIFTASFAGLKGPPGNNNLLELQREKRNQIV
jgi:hypothetical protein